MDSLSAHREFYSQLVASAAEGPEQARIAAAFRTVPRENFVGPGPWHILAHKGYIETPTADPAFLYTDVLVSLTPDRPINNGQPSLHALCLAALAVQPGEAVLHIGAGTGYYTAILATLASPTGSVIAYEIEADLAVRATANLATYPNVTVENRSGSVEPLPQADVIYVNAGATEPLQAWIEALRPGNGRLLFPLTPDAGFGAMLLVSKIAAGCFAARFPSRAMFIPCIGARDEETATALARVFRRNTLEDVRSLVIDRPSDHSCWFAGRGWWLSTQPAT